MQNSMRFLKNIELSFDPASPILLTYPKKMELIHQIDASIPNLFWHWSQQTRYGIDLDANQRGVEIVNVIKIHSQILLTHK